MSEAVFSKLPRFDGLTTHVGARPRLDRQAQPREPSLEDQVREQRGRIEEERQEQETRYNRKMDAVEQTLALLAGKVEQIEADAREQTAASVASIAERLFPKLARRFLAEEIALHLEKMIPPGQVCIDIKAEPHLAEQLYEVLQRSSHLAEICNVVPQESSGGSRVDVSWKSGGLDFDFDGLLEACIGHLRSERSSEGEIG